MSADTVVEAADDAARAEDARHVDGEAGAAAWIVRSVPELRTLLGV